MLQMNCKAGWKIGCQVKWKTEIMVVSMKEHRTEKNINKYWEDSKMKEVLWVKGSSVHLVTCCLAISSGWSCIGHILYPVTLSKENHLLPLWLQYMQHWATDFKIPFFIN